MNLNKMRATKILLVLLLMMFFVLQSSFSATFSMAKNSEERIVIDKTLHTLTHYDEDGNVEHCFPISCGAFSTQSEEGNFKIFSRSMNPRWWLDRWLEDNPNAKPYQPYIKDPSNPLGTRFMAFNTVYGIHGTNEPMVIGRHVSHGCIRMQITNNETLFPTVEYGTPVEVRSDPNIQWRTTNSFSSWWGIHNILNLARRTRAWKEKPDELE